MSLIQPSFDSTQDTLPEQPATPAAPSTENRLKSRVLKDTAIEEIKVDQTGQQCLDIRKILIDDTRGRKDFSNIYALKESLEKLGMLSPIVVMPRNAEGMYPLVAGERRFRAFLLTGERYIPFTWKDDYDSLAAKEAELEENLQRENLSWPEQAELLRQIDEIKKKKYGPKTRGDTTPGWSTKNTAELVNMDPSHVGKTIRLAKLLQERPELKAKVEHLPLTAAMRRLDQIQATEKAEKQIEKGEIVISGEVLLGSALDLIKEVKTTTVDLICTDPPFGQTTITQQQDSQRSNMVYTGIISNTDNLSPGEVRVLLKALIPELYRVLKDDGFLFMFFAFEHYEFIQQTMRGAGFQVDYAPLIWWKGRATTPFSGYSFPSSYEPIIVAHKANPRRLHNPPMNIIKHDPIHAKSKVHSFQKPGSLLAELVQYATAPGDLVLDPFGGSCEIVRVCTALKRNALAFEINKENWTRAQVHVKTPYTPSGNKPKGQAANENMPASAVMAQLVAVSKGGAS